MIRHFKLTEDFNFPLNYSKFDDVKNVTTTLSLKSGDQFSLSEFEHEPSNHITFSYKNYLLVHNDRPYNTSVTMEFVRLNDFLFKDITKIIDREMRINEIIS